MDLHRWSKEGLIMNTRENGEKDYIEIKSPSNGQIEAHPDEKVRLIYERYHAGKTIILDDLKYLWLKDPEGCKRLTKSIIEAKSKQSQETEIKDEGRKLESTSLTIKKPDAMDDQINSFDIKSSEETLLSTFVNIQDMMSSMKLMLDQMSTNELMEMWNHINEALILEKIGDKMKCWDDVYEDKIMMNSYEVEKKFNKLA
jgi:hypothetical protein